MCTKARPNQARDDQGRYQSDLRRRQDLCDQQHSNNRGTLDPQEAMCQRAV